MEVRGQHHAPAALPPRKIRYTLYRRLGGAQGRYGRVRTPPPNGIRLPDRPARSESLCWLSYPGPQWKDTINESNVWIIINNSVFRKGSSWDPIQPTITLHLRRIKPLGNIIHLLDQKGWSTEGNLLYCDHTNMEANEVLKLGTIFHESNLIKRKSFLCLFVMDWSCRLRGVDRASEQCKCCSSTAYTIQKRKRLFTNLCSSPV